MEIDETLQRLMAGEAPELPEGEPAQQPEFTDEEGALKPEGGGEPPAEPPAPAAEDKIRVKYNHEERELTRAEATELAQKGLYADKLRERQEKLEEMARQSGFPTLAAFEEAWREQQKARKDTEFRAKTGIERNALEPVIREAIDSNPDVQAAREIVRRNQLDEAVRTLKQAVPECAYQSAQDLFADPQFGEINRLVQAGLTLDKAYGAVYAMDIAQKRAAADTQNPQAAPAPSTGSVKTAAPPTKAAYISPEEVDKMTPDEVRKNLDLIEKSMPKWPVK